MIVGGCVGHATRSERLARAELRSVGQVLISTDQRLQLTARSSFQDLMTFALLNNPRVRAAYYDWAGSVEQLTLARSLPDPRLTFSADIADMVMAVMPGLMVDLPDPGKLKAAAKVADAQAQVRYQAFIAEVLRTAFSVKDVYYRLELLEQNIQIQREVYALLRGLEQQARQRQSAGLAGIQDVLWAQIELEQLATSIEGLVDCRSAFVAEFKAALGLGPKDPDPPIPQGPDHDEPEPDANQVLDLALQQSPAIKQLEAQVRQAIANMELSRRSRVPDLSVGLEADVRASPVMWTPTVSLTLPIWKDKISAQISGAQAAVDSAKAKLSQQQVQLSADLAAMLYLYRQAVRDKQLLADGLIPKATAALDAARAGYANGSVSFLDVMEASRQLLGFRLSLIQASTRGKQTLAAISLLIAGILPEGSLAELQQAEAIDQGEN